MADIPTLAFVFSIVAVGLLLTAAIRRDLVNKQRIRRDLQRQADHLRARRGPAQRH